VDRKKPAVRSKTMKTKLKKKKQSKAKKTLKTVSIGYDNDDK
jgi:hypothetical protein